MEQKIVLQLNGNWQPIGIKSVKEAVVALNSEDDPTVLSFDIEFSEDDNGEVDFSSPIYLNPVPWSEWIKLPIRSYDSVIHSANLEIRVPTVLIASNYRDMPMRKLTLTKENVYKRDRGICQYTGKAIPPERGNIDHVVARSKGGKNTWDNLVWCDKEVNLKKGDLTVQASGLKLIRKPAEPPLMPVSTYIKECKHGTWEPFLLK